MVVLQIIIYTVIYIITLAIGTCPNGLVAECVRV